MSAHYPFSFPIVLVFDGGAVFVCRESMTPFMNGKVSLGFSVFASEGLFHPRRVIAVRPTGRRIFNTDLVDVDFEWSGKEAFALNALAQKLRDAIESDDDIHAQLRSHEEHLAAIDAAKDFTQLVDAIDPA